MYVNQVFMKLAKLVKSLEGSDFGWTLLVFILKEKQKRFLYINTTPNVQKIREWEGLFLKLAQDFLGLPGRGAGVDLWLRCTKCSGPAWAGERLILWHMRRPLSITLFISAPIMDNHKNFEDVEKMETREVLMAHAVIVLTNKIKKINHSKS